MDSKNIAAASIFLLLLAGCGSVPRTPDLLIESAKGGSMFSDKDVFVVKQPIAQVTAVLKNKSAECLQQKITMTWRQGGMDRRQVVALTPKLKAGKELTQLTVQNRVVEGTIELGDPPPDGWYFLVVNAYPQGSNSTRVESYYLQTSYKTAFAAIKPWVTEASTGCPDLTK